MLRVCARRAVVGGAAAAAVLGDQAQAETSLVPALANPMAPDETAVAALETALMQVPCTNQTRAWVLRKGLELAQDPEIQPLLLARARADKGPPIAGARNALPPTTVPRNSPPPPPPIAQAVPPPPGEHDGEAVPDVSALLMQNQQLRRQVEALEARLREQGDDPGDQGGGGGQPPGEAAQPHSQPQPTQGGGGQPPSDQGQDQDQAQANAGWWVVVVGIAALIVMIFAK